MPVRVYFNWDLVLCLNNPLTRKSSMLLTKCFYKLKPKKGS